MGRFLGSSLFLVLLLVPLASAGEETLLLRNPTVSAEQIAFVYAGDIWITGREGGQAQRLTVHPAQEGGPVFSPDGRWIAFTGFYDGGVDVYVVSVDGGSPRRLTFHPGADVVRGWTPDGGKVLFNSFRLSYSRFGRLFSVPLEGGFPEALPMPMAEKGCYSPDGKRIAYTPIQDSFQTWKRYRGGTTPPVWIFDFATSEVEKIPHPGSNDTTPIWLDSTIYFLSDRNRIMNVFAYDTRTKRITQLTHHSDYDVRSASAGDGVIVYEQGGRIHLLERDGTSRPLAIRINADLPQMRPHYAQAAKYFRSAAISPSGKRAVVEARGEIFSVPAKKGNVRNLTRTPGVHERSPSWSPDGKWIAYYSDLSGEYRLMLREQSGLEDAREIVLGDGTFYYEMTWSPDSKRIAYTDKRLNLWIMEIDGGGDDQNFVAPIKVDTDTFDHPERSLAPEWSPDSRWLAYTKRLDNHLRAVFVYDVENGERHQLTDGMSDAISPAFSRDGKFLCFGASTNYGLQTGWLDMTSYERPVSRSLYLAVLSRDEKSPFAPESDEEEVAEDVAEEQQDQEADEQSGDNETAEDTADAGAQPDEPADVADTGEADEAAKPDEAALGDAQKGKKKGNGDAVEVCIDFEGIDQRILALPVPARDYQQLEAADGGKLFYSERIENQPGLTLHRFDMQEREAQVFLGGVQGFAVSADGKKMIYAAGRGGSSGGPTVGIVSTAGKPKSGDGRLDLSAMEVRVEPRVEWAQMFEEVWRIERDFFYDPNMHGCDWPAIKEKYRPFLAHVGHRSDLNYLLSEMIGEMVVGHNYVGGGDSYRPETVPVGLLGAEFEIAEGHYRIAKIYTGENWNPELRAPLTEPGIDVAQGDYILAVNGRPLAAEDNIFGHFEKTAGFQTVLLVNGEPSREGARQVTVLPVSSDRRLRYRDWIEGNRRKVSEMTGGRVAYIYMPNTAGGGYTAFNRYFFSQQDKEALIIDERFNGGGSVADYVIDLLRRKPLNYTVTREGKIQPTPTAIFPGPKVMIINEYAGSGGDAMPYYFRLTGIGKLVGKRTWGGLVGIYDYPPLMDGGFIAAPRIAFLGLNGEWIVENEGVWPDVEVEMTPKLVIEGHDPQLEKAIEIVLQELESRPKREVQRPAYPKRAL